MYNRNIAFTKDGKYIFTLPTEKTEDRRFVYVSRNISDRRSNYIKFWLEPEISLGEHTQRHVSPAPYESDDLNYSERKEAEDLTRANREQLVSQWDKWYGERGTDIDLIEI